MGNGFEWRGHGHNRLAMRPFEIHVEHELSALKAVRRTLDKWLQGRGLPDRPRAEVVLATHEALANAIEHSDSAKPIRIKAEARSDGFVIEITETANGRSRGRIRGSNADADCK